MAEQLWWKADSLKLRALSHLYGRPWANKGYYVQATRGTFSLLFTVHFVHALWFTAAFLQSVQPRFPLNLVTMLDLIHHLPMKTIPGWMRSRKLIQSQYGETQGCRINLFAIHCFEIQSIADSILCLWLLHCVWQIVQEKGHTKNTLKQFNGSLRQERSTINPKIL